jgi:hypothetical protein
MERRGQMQNLFDEVLKLRPNLEPTLTTLGWASGSNVSIPVAELPSAFIIEPDTAVAPATTAPVTPVTENSYREMVRQRLSSDGYEIREKERYGALRFPYIARKIKKGSFLLRDIQHLFIRHYTD